LARHRRGIRGTIEIRLPLAPSSITISSNSKGIASRPITACIKRQSVFVNKFTPEFIDKFTNEKTACRESQFPAGRSSPTITAASIQCQSVLIRFNPYEIS
jgi:hypothetical protein